MNPPNALKRSVSDVWTQKDDPVPLLKKPVAGHIEIMRQFSDPVKQFGLYWLLNQTSTLQKQVLTELLLWVLVNVNIEICIIKLG
jgi:hypothetical protein